MNNFMEPTLKETKDFIANCELGECLAPSSPLAPLPPAAMMMRDEGDQDDKGTGAVVEGGLMAFTPGTSVAVRKDVEDCLLFATLVANKAFSIETQNQAWFAKFNEVLLNLGWPVRHLEYHDYQSGGSNLTMDKLILEMLASAIATASLPGTAGAKLLKTVTDMIDRFSSQEKALKLFEQKSMSQQGANFRVGTCHEAEDGVVYITLSTVNFSIKRQMTSVLGFTWNSGEAQIYAANRGLTFNRRFYDDVRDTVNQKLGNDARQNIEEFEI